MNVNVNVCGGAVENLTLSDVKNDFRLARIHTIFQQFKFCSIFYYISLFFVVYYIETNNEDDDDKITENFQRKHLIL